MAKYKVLAESWVGDRLVPKDTIIEFAGQAGSNLELVEAEKPKSKKAAAASVSDADADANSVI